MKQEASPYLDFKATSLLTPSAGKCRADNAFSSEIFSEETLSQIIAPGTRGFRTITGSTTRSIGELAIPWEMPRPGGGPPGALLAPPAVLASQDGLACSQLGPFPCGFSPVCGVKPLCSLSTAFTMVCSKEDYSSSCLVVGRFGEVQGARGHLNPQGGRCSMRLRTHHWG